ncbi:hypothetical protein [Vampirovibrio sp.]|uniref:hypothetical protein n=1 Tax=Vampirovibrio sp. TaxID=2717857 RepID=UPI00359450FF
MAEDTHKSIFHYEIDPLIKPGANLSVWVWLVLLGLPALLLTLIFAKTEDRHAIPAKPPAAFSAAPLAPAASHNHP